MTYYTKDGQTYYGSGSIIIGTKRVFNPTQEQILAAGWEKHQVEPTPVTLKDYQAAVDAEINRVAAMNDFDSIQTCTKYAGFDNPFRNHAEALLSWNSLCWVTCHTIMDDFQAGKIAQPTIQQLVNMLPGFSYSVGA